MNDPYLVASMERYAAQYRSLCRLVPSLDGGRRKVVQSSPVALQPLAESDGVGFRAPRGVQPGFEDDLRQADVRRHAESLVNGAPLGEERAISAGVGQQRVSPRRVVQHRSSRALEQGRHLLSPFTQFARELLAVEDAGDRGIAPHGLPRPHSLGGKRREKASVNGAAECDRVIGNGEDVLPERVAGPEGLHGGEVGSPARFDGVFGSVWRVRRIRSGYRRTRAACDDVPRGHGNRRGQRDECQDDLRAQRAPSNEVF